MPDMTDRAGEPAGPRQDAGDTIEAGDTIKAGETIAERAAELATEVTEARQPEERRRLTAAFAAAARSGARATGRGARAVQRGTIASSGWLTGQVVEMAPRVRVRNQAMLRAQFPGMSIEDAADALITGAARASATVGAAGAARLPGGDSDRDAGPDRHRAQAHRGTARALRHARARQRRGPGHRLHRLVGASPRGAGGGPRRADHGCRVAAGQAAAAAAVRARGPEHVLARPAVHRGDGRRGAQQQGDPQARHGDPR